MDRREVAVHPYALRVLVGRAGLSPEMVGRSIELERLADLIGVGKVPTVALVAGEAGIGKTRLVQELVARAPRGTLVLAGQADPDTSTRPLALFLDALTAAAPPVDDRDVERMQLEAAVRDVDAPADDRIAAAVQLVRHLAGGSPALLIFEDLHWADAESLVIFERLAEPDGSTLLAVGTYRPDGLSRRHPASELLPRLERRHAVTHLHLERLSAQDVGILLNAVYGELPSFRTTTALHVRTGGNPFFLEELMASSPGFPTCDTTSMPLPWTVSEVVRSQFDDLDHDVRRIVAAASELGRRVPFDVLAAVTETSEDHLIPLLRVAVDSGLLVETEPDVFGFHHEIAREAIAGSLLGRERRRLHQTALDVLRAAGSVDHTAMARHANGAGRFDEMVEEARLGAHESLARGSSYQALQLAEMALDEAEDNLDLLSLATRAAYLTGVIDEAAEYGDRWLTMARDCGDISDEANALALRMRLAYEASDLDGMATFTDELAAAVDRLPTDEERAQAMAALAQSYMLRDEVDPTIEWADKAHELASRDRLTSVRLAAQVEKGSVLLFDSRTNAEGKALLRSTIDEAERCGDHMLAARAINNLVWHSLGWENADKVRLLIDDMRRHAKAAGWLTGSGHTEALAQLAAVEGDLDAAIGLLDDAYFAHHKQIFKAGRWRAVRRAGFALEAGNLEAAARYIAEAKPTTERTAAGVLGLDFHLAARRGDLAGARAVLPQVLAAIEAEGVGSPSQAHDLITAGLRAGMKASELRPLADLVGSYPRHRLPPEDAWRRLIDAQFTEAEGRIAEAAELYVAAAAELGNAPTVIAGHRGTAHVRAARTLVALGRLDEARAQAADAEKDLARWRGWRVDELRAVERRLGIGTEPSGPGALTPREREVAALLAEGLTNSVVAERLYISPRTAAVHVSNILAKLGMSSRAEVAAWAASGGLDAEAQE